MMCARFTLGMALTCFAACHAEIGPGEPDPVGGSVPSEPSPVADKTVVSPSGERPAPTPRLARLTHTQWANTVEDLLGLDASQIAATLRADPRQNGFLFSNNASALIVDEGLWGAYQRAASELGGLATAAAESLRKVTGTLPADGAARTDAFLSGFGKRAYRRPLGDRDLAEYRTLFARGAQLFPGMRPFDAGVRLVIEAMLQSPHFLYRLETSANVEDGVIPLDGYEVAARLSYLLWDTMPDPELFAAAEGGRLEGSAGVAEQARRLLGHDRARPALRRFHEQLLEVERFANISPSAEAYPQAPEMLGDLAARESALFFDDLVVGRRGLVDLLTSEETFVNADLARLYQVGSPGADFGRVKLDPTKRRGFLTQIGFLASHATTVDPDPIHRGVFIANRLLCSNITAPPAEIPPLPDAAGRTNREAVRDHTEQPGTACQACHGTLINPLGFAFEHYDAVGGYRTHDADKLVDARVTPLIDGTPVPVENAVELVQALARSPAVHQCYTSHWLGFAFGRPGAAEDKPLADRLAASSEKRTSIHDLIVSLVTSRPFLTRHGEELP